MSNKDDKLKKTKENFLFDAISFISIIDVEEKKGFDGSLNLYIKTNNLETVDMDNLRLLSERLSIDGVEVQVVKAENNITGELVDKNIDVISVYIE